MSDENVVNLGDAAVVKRLERKPVTYSVELTHFVIDGEWNMGIKIHDLAQMDPETRRRVADDLEQAAAMIRKSENWEATT